MKNMKIVFSDISKVDVVVDEITEHDLKVNEILVKNHYSLISAGTELACLAGKESSWFKFPETPGYCSAGEIVACGDDTGEFKKGDLVFFYGSHSAYCKVNVKDELCVKLIAGLDIRYAPFARVATIAMTAIRTSCIELGDYVAVTGMGVVGNMAAQLAGLQGGKVIGIDLDEQRLKQAEACGVPYTVNSGKADAVEEVKKITGLAGINTYIDATGISAVGVGMLPAVARGGEVVFLGTPRDEFITNATDILRAVHLADSALKFKGAHEWIYPVKQDKFVKHSFERNTSICFELIRDGKLKIDPLLSHVIRPEEAAKAYEGLKSKKNEYFGVLINWTEE